MSGKMKVRGFESLLAGSALSREIDATNLMK
jgi:hypothetical protein